MKKESEPLLRLKRQDDQTSAPPSGDVKLELVMTPYCELALANFMAIAGYPMPADTERESAERLARVLNKETLKS